MDAADHILRRPPSIGTPPYSTTTTPTSTSSSSFSSSVDFELVSMKPTSYTSLRDILPPAPAIHSPKTPANSGYEISIRNRLVKQAAWAYLQPMVSTYPESDGSTVFHRFWTQLSGAVLRLVTAVFDCLLQSIQVGTISYRL